MLNLLSRSIALILDSLWRISLCTLNFVGSGIDENGNQWLNEKREPSLRTEYALYIGFIFIKVILSPVRYTNHFILGTCSSSHHPTHNPPFHQSGECTRRAAFSSNPLGPKVSFPSFALPFSFHLLFSFLRLQSITRDSSPTGILAMLCYF